MRIKKPISNTSTMTHEEKVDLQETLFASCERVDQNIENYEKQLQALQYYIDQLPPYFQERIMPTVRSLHMLLHDFESEANFMFHHAQKPFTKIWLDKIGG